MEGQRSGSQEGQNISKSYGWILMKLRVQIHIRIRNSFFFFFFFEGQAFRSRSQKGHQNILKSMEGFRLNFSC